jgi:type 1 glutamine amidotransferase
LGWSRHEGSARVAYCALGHDQRSLDDPAHQRLLGRIIEWLTEAPA